MEIRKSPYMSRGRSRFRKKTWGELKFTQKSDPYKSANLKQIKKKRINKQTENPEKGGEYDCQNCHNIGFKCPVFNKKIARHTNKQGNVI